MSNVSKTHIDSVCTSTTDITLLRFQGQSLSVKHSSSKTFINIAFTLLQAEFEYFLSIRIEGTLTKKNMVTGHDIISSY